MSSILKRSWWLLGFALTVAVPNAQDPGVGAGREAVATLPLDGAVDAAEDARLFVEIASPERAVFRGEIAETVLRLGFEQSFFETQILSLFRQEMDLPVQIQVPWDDELECVARGLWVEGGPVRLARNGAVGGAWRAVDEVRGGKRFVVHELRWQWVSSCAGELVLPSPVVRFAYASAFRQDVFQGRVPIDRVDAFRRGPRTSLDVQPLPEPVPDEFCGAVGAFRIDAEVDREHVVAGDSFALRVRVRGQGALDSVRAPTLPDWERVHVLGVVDRPIRAGREFRFELSALRPGVLDLPLAVATFDPRSPGRYQVHDLEGLRVFVSVGAQPNGEPSDVVPGVDDVHPLKVGVGARSGIGAPVWLVLLPWIAAVGVRAWWAGRRRRGVDPVRERTRAALAEFETRADSEAAFPEFLSRCLGASAAAIGPDAAPRLTGLGVPKHVVDRAVAEVERSTASRYGGADDASREDLVGLARAVAAALLNRAR